MSRVCVKLDNGDIVVGEEVPFEEFIEYLNEENDKLRVEMSQSKQVKDIFDLLNKQDTISKI